MDLPWLSLAARAALLALLAAQILGALLLRLRVRRDAARAREALGEPRGQLEGMADGDQLTLIGPLEAIGPLCRRFEDGALVAAATAQGEQSPTPLRARAERLQIVLADRAVEILGPVEVLAGSREERPGVGLSRLAVAVRHRVVEAAEEAAGGGDPNLRGKVRLRSLRSGDRVLARGVLRRGGAPSAAHAYRDAAAPWTLSADATVVELAFEGAPHVHGPLGAFASGLRDTRRLVAAMITAALGVLVLAALHTVEWQGTPGAAVSPPAKPRPRFGDANLCRTLAARYAAERDLRSRCESDDDCGADIRGEQWIELDGCFRFKNRREPTGAADALAQAWFEEGCSSQYELCRILPQAMCRKGQCVERPPPPIPEGWVRRDVAHLYTFFAPPELKQVHGGGNCTGGLSYGFEREGLALYVDYDANEVAAPAHARDVTIGQDSVKLATFEGYDPMASGWSKHRIEAFFPDAPPCPPFYCFAADGKAAMKVTAYCLELKDCQIGMEAIQSFRRW